MEMKAKGVRAAEAGAVHAAEMRTVQVTEGRAAHEAEARGGAEAVILNEDARRRSKMQYESSATLQTI